MSKRVDALKEKLRQHIVSGAAGYREGLPSLRELMQLFGESHHVVNSALKALEREGILLCQPYKGFQVARPYAAPAPVRSAAELNVIILEENIWQIDFWCWVVKQFELHHSDCRLSPRFLTDEAAVIEFLGRRPPDEPAVVVHATDAIVNAGPTIPRPEIARQLGHPLPLAELLPGLLDPLHAFSIPYQIQPPLLYYSREKEISGYDWRAGYPAFLDWLEHNCAPGRFAPLNIPLVMGALGMEGLILHTRPEIRAKLEFLQNIFERFRDNRFFNLHLPSGRFADLKQLAAGGLDYTLRGSFCAGAAGLPESAGRIGLVPPPVQPDGRLIQPVPYAVIAGNRCTSAAARFVEFLLSDEVQRTMMQRCLGLSPLDRILRAAEAEPAGYPFDIAPVIRYVRQEYPKSLPGQIYQPESDYDFLIETLTDRMVLPLLTGAADRRNSKRMIDELEELFLARAAQLRPELNRNRLRSQLLTGA